jgi:hypothetical protein
MRDTITGTTTGEVVTYEAAFASKNLFEFYQVHGFGDSIPNYLRSWYFYSFRYDDLGNQVFQLSSILTSFKFFPDWTESTQNDEHRFDMIISDRYPMILSSAINLGLGLSRNPCVPFIGPTPPIDYSYISPNISFELCGDCGNWAIFRAQYPANPNDFEKSNFSYTSYNPSKSWPAFVPLNISGNVSERELEFLTYQWTKYLNFSDSEVNPCIFGFNNSLTDDMQIRLGQGQFPQRLPNPPTDHSYSSTHDGDKVQGAMIVLGVAAGLAVASGMLLIIKSCKRLRSEESQSILHNESFAQRCTNSLVSGARSIANLFGCRRNRDYEEDGVLLERR